MILKCKNIYVDLMSVRAYEFKPIQGDTETGGLVTSITFYIVPKPIVVAVPLTDDQDVKKARRVLELVGEAIAKLICAARKKENGNHLEDLSRIVLNARAIVEESGRVEER